MKFSERLQILRNEHGLTQNQLADKLGIKQQAISQYEKGTSLPKIDIILKVAQIFNVPLGYVMGVTDERNIDDLPEDSKRLLEIYDSLPEERKNISIELLRVLKETSEK